MSPIVTTQSAILIALHDDILLHADADESPVKDDDTSTLAPTATTTYRLDQDICVIGRDPSCHVRVNKHRTDISRKHATIQRDGDGYTLYDYSLYGTFVNGQKISGLCRLDTDDVIGFANSKEMLRFIDLDRPAHSPIVLTERELDVLRLLADGRTIKQIADHLVISQNTVNSHLKNLYDKLAVNSRGAAVSRAQKLRLL
jgi:DNA-binding NarL/FixJ family response regulator